MKLQILALATTLISISAQADQFKTVNEKMDRPNNTFDMSYPELLPGSVPAWGAINKNLREALLAMRCDDPEPGSDRTYEVSISGSIVAINPHYVGVELSVDMDCG